MARDNIRKLPSGNFQARFRHQHTGETVCATFPRKAEARDWLVSQRADVQRGEWIDPRSGRTTLADFAESWLGSHQVRPTTRRGYESDLKVHILPSLGALPIGSITPERVRDWVEERRATGHVGAAAKAYRTLSTIMNAAVADGRLARSPCTVTGAARPPEREMRALTSSELWQLHDKMAERYRALVLVLGLGGLRWGEAAALRVGDVDLDRGRVRVVRQIRESSSGYEFDTPKTSAGRRTVGLPQFAAESLADHITSYTDGDPDSLIFSMPSGTPLRNSNFRRREWADATADLSWRPRIHDLRHTCASLAIAAGADIKTLQQMMGHSSAAMTLDRYGHLMGDSTDRGREALDQWEPPKGFVRVW